jgi:hypothetical protein
LGVFVLEQVEREAAAEAVKALEGALAEKDAAAALHLQAAQRATVRGCTGLVCTSNTTKR